MGRRNCPGMDARFVNVVCHNAAIDDLFARQRGHRRPLRDRLQEYLSSQAPEVGRATSLATAAAV